MSNRQRPSRTEEARRFKFVVLNSFLKKLVKMVDKEELKRLLEPSDQNQICQRWKRKGTEGEENG